MKMNKHLGICSGLFLCAALFSCTAVSGADATGGKNPVKVSVDEVGWSCSSNTSDDVWEENPARLNIGVRLSIPGQEGFLNHFGPRRQYLDATDSTGRKLAPVEFDFTLMSRIRRGGDACSSVSGTVREVPGPDASWVRLRGKFRMFLARVVKGDVYELPLMKGAEVQLSLPRGDVEAGAESGDVAVAGETPGDKLCLTGLSTFEKDGKKMIRAEIWVKAKMPFDLEDIHILNEKDEELNVEFLGGSSFFGEDYIHNDKEFQLEDPGNLKQFKVRLFYRTLKKEVAVPVDIKVGMTGEIRKKHESVSGIRKER